MAALTITAANVSVGSNAQVQVVEVGENVTHGEVLYLNTTNADYRLADSTSGGNPTAKAISITSGAAGGSFIAAILRGDLVLGAILTVGTEYYLGATPGTIVPKSDLVSTNFVTRLGIATTTSVLNVDIDVSGVQLP